MNTPFYKSKQYKTGNEVYPKVTVEFWNVPYDKAIKRLKSGKPQRIQVAWPEMGTMFEVMIVPLDNQWDSTRMTGTGGKVINITPPYTSADKRMAITAGLEVPIRGTKTIELKANPYYFIGIDRKGCYTFNFEHDPEAGYIGSKLGLGSPEAWGMKLLFKELNKGLNG